MRIDPVLIPYNIVRSDYILNENRKYVNISIDEALGINDEVRAEARKFFDRIIKDIFEVCKVDAEGDGYKRRHLDYGKCTVFGDVIVSVTCDCFCFDNKEALEKNGGIEAVNTGSSMYGDLYLPSGHKLRNDYINVVFYAVSGTIDKANLMDTLQHELLHVYEQYRQGWSYSNRSDHGLYANITSRMGKYKVGDDGYYMWRLMYLSFEDEQRGFVNGFDGYVMKTMEDLNTADINAVINGAPLNKDLANMRAFINRVKDGYIAPALSNEFMEFTGKPFSEFLEIAEKTMKQLSMRLGRAIIKIKDDLGLWELGEQYVRF